MTVFIMMAMLCLDPASPSPATCRVVEGASHQTRDACHAAMLAFVRPRGNQIVEAFCARKEAP